MLRIVCLDDDFIQHDNLKHLFKLSDFEVEATFFSDSKSLFFEMDPHIDAFFLDIEMEGMSGMEVASELRSKGVMVPIVFITGYSQYAIEGYDVQAFDYILKPISLEKINTLLEKLSLLKKEDLKQVSLFDIDNSKIRIDHDDILGFEAQGDTVRLITTQGDYDIKSTLSSLSKELGTTFIACHRSYIVNLKHIERVEKDALLLTNKERFPISRRLKSELNKTINEYYEQGAYQL